jgi:hypothetical protein
MKTISLNACLAVAATLVTTPVLAQDAPAAQETLAQDNAAAAEVAPASSEEWTQFSQNDRTIYLIDLKSFKPVGNALTVRIARVPTQGGTSTFMHRIDEYEIRCSGNQARMMVEVEFDDAGNEIERYPEAEAVFETIRPTSLPAYFKSMPCEHARPAGDPAPSIKAFIERGRQ